MKPKFDIAISKAAHICLRNGIKVYPVIVGRDFKIEVDNNGEILRYNKKVNSKNLNSAISKTVKYYALNIIKQNKNANNTK